MTIPIPVTLEGTTFSTGAFNPALRLITQISMGTGRSVGNGSIALLQSDVPGAFADFALVPNGPTIYTDPAFSYPTSGVIRSGGTDPVNTWKRLSITLQAPNHMYSPGPIGAVYGVFDYARLGVTSSAMALNETHQLAYVQFERTPQGLDADANQFGSNLFDLEQSSYEGRLMYRAVGGGGETDNMTFTRTNEFTSCGEYSGKLVYQSPPATNSYTAVQQFGTYPNLLARRQTYADVRYRAFLPGEGPPENPGGTGVVSGTPIAAPAVLTLTPLQSALVRVEPGVTYQAQVSVAAGAAGQQVSCAVLRYDSSFNLIGTYQAGPAATTLGSYRWQQVGVACTMDATAAYAAVVPRVTTAGASRVEFYTDEHRLWVPSTLATKAGGASPARPWQPPRQLIIKLRATRVNYVRNPSFKNSVWGWSQVKDPSLTASFTLLTSEGVDGNCGRYSVENSPTGTLIAGTSPVTGVTSVTGPNGLVERLRPATVYTASVYVRPVLRAVPVTLWAHNGDQLVRGTSTPVFDAAGNTEYFRLHVTFKTNSTFGGAGAFTLGYAAEDMARVYSAVQPGTDDTFWTVADADPTGVPAWSQTGTYLAADKVTYDGVVWQARVNNGPYPNAGPFTFYFDQFLVEQADKVAPYFDGGYPSADYLWEGTPGDSRSHYYRGKRATQYRLDQIIQRQLGVGASYRLVYASTP